MNKYNFNSLERITKTTARKLYNAGSQIIIVPCKANPLYSGFYPSYFSKESTCKDFESLINEFIYYNCNYNELGYYPAYYIEVTQ